MIINGNNIEELKKFDNNYFDSIVTDPPYEIGFMGKSWDASGIANNPEMWAECLRVLKPGGYLLSFSATRTYHRMAVAIEDSGFEIRDMIEWVYGSGFPKSLNIGKAVDKINGEMGRSYKFTKWLREDAGMRISDVYVHLLDKAKNEATAKAMAQHYISDKQQPAIPTAEIWGRIRPHIKTEIPQWVDELVERIEREREIVGRGKAGLTSGTIANFAGEKEFDLTKGTSEWEGWQTALKPAHEPICMARKPLAEKTVAENVLKYGTGGINIDESRVENTTDKVGSNGAFGFKEENGWNKNNLPDSVSGEQVIQGRFPANLIHDNSEEVRECFPETKGATSRTDGSGVGMFASGNKEAGVVYQDNQTNASRFFKSIIYQAKASKSERNKGCEELEEKENAGSYEFRTDGSLDGKPTQPKSNHHPTVKPVALMEYLIKMVTPTNGIVLDPFMGSGSTGVACVLNDFEFVGMDLDKDYCEIARARIEGVKETQTKMF